MGACCVVPLPELESLLLLGRGLLLARNWPVGRGLSPGEDDLISEARVSFWQARLSDSSLSNVSLGL